VISGRRSFEPAGRWQGHHRGGVPIFVLTHHVGDGDVPPGHAQFVTDIEDCARRARLDDRDVTHLRYRVRRPGDAA
jgi:hypothetical protein